MGKRRNRTETLGNMLTVRPDEVSVRGVRVPLGKERAIKLSGGKRAGSQVFADVEIPVGRGSVHVGRNSLGQYVRVTQRWRDLMMEGGIDPARGVNVKVGGSLRWGK